MSEKNLVKEFCQQTYVSTCRDRDYNNKNVKLHTWAEVAKLSGLSDADDSTECGEQIFIICFCWF